ncbi:hypothetical protein VNI00_006892 [Paramarasmius palmivorus]|uniref:Uncharacterized protein n=1 Tax=Paramarasmius palmivorus TaxID=297713 RepID=A0AAW0D4C1_9AGAR
MKSFVATTFLTLGAASYAVALPAPQIQVPSSSVPVGGVESLPTGQVAAVGQDATTILSSSVLVTPTAVAVNATTDIASNAVSTATVANDALGFLPRQEAVTSQVPTSISIPVEQAAVPTQSLPASSVQNKINEQTPTLATSSVPQLETVPTSVSTEHVHVPRVEVATGAAIAVPVGVLPRQEDLPVSSSAVQFDAPTSVPVSSAAQFAPATSIPISSAPGFVPRQEDLLVSSSAVQFDAPTSVPVSSVAQFAPTTSIRATSIAQFATQSAPVSATEAADNVATSSAVDEVAAVAPSSTFSAPITEATSEIEERQVFDECDEY